MYKFLCQTPNPLFCVDVRLVYVRWSNVGGACSLVGHRVIGVSRRTDDGVTLRTPKSPKSVFLARSRRADRRGYIAEREDVKIGVLDVTLVTY